MDFAHQHERNVIHSDYTTKLLHEITNRFCVVDGIKCTLTVLQKVQKWPSPRKTALSLANERYPPPRASRHSASCRGSKSVLQIGTLDFPKMVDPQIECLVPIFCGYASELRICYSNRVTLINLSKCTLQSCFFANFGNI